MAVPSVEAQDVASSFDQLRALVKPGDTVRVTDGTGRETRGTVATVTSSSLELTVEGSRRSFLETETRTVRQRRSDPLKNGLLIGLAVGAGFGAVSFFVTDDSEEAIAATAIYAGLGSAVGLAVDAARRSTQVIFSRPARTSARLSFAPLVTRDRKGALVSLGF